jgi:hypothetical protein
MSLNLRTISGGTPLTQSQLDGNFTFLYGRDITGSTVTGTTLFLYKQDGTVLETQLPSNSGGTGVDTFTTGFTFTNNNTLTISRNQGLSNLPVTINNLTLTGLTVNGSISATTYLNLPPFTGNTSASCITDLYVSNIYGCSPITIHDSIQSVGSSATGITSFAFGKATKAFGGYSHAEGELTQAINNNSHAEGLSTIAFGTGSHAEGQSTKAIGNYSHSEGISTSATTTGSHAEGSGTTASGISSHAEGLRTIASGNYSHAEGYFVVNKSLANPVFNRAIGIGSHAEGGGTMASGTTSHSEGELTQAIGQGSHTEGLSTQAINVYSHAEGINTQAIGQGSHTEGLSTQAIGGASHAEGVGTQAISYTSHAEGYYTNSIGIGSHAEGYYTNSIGLGSHTEGGFSTVLGGTIITEEGGPPSVVSGVSYANYSHAEGYGSVVGLKRIGITKVIAGVSYDATRYELNVAGDYSYILSGSYLTFYHNEVDASFYNPNNPQNLFGLNVYGQVVTATYFPVDDYTKIVLTPNSIPPNTILSGLSTNTINDTVGGGYVLFDYLFSTSGFTNHAHAEGYNTWSVGLGSHSEGKETLAFGDYSHSQGNRTIAYGAYSHAEGYFGVDKLSNTYFNKAIGIGSHAEGVGTVSGAYAYLVSGTSGNDIVLNPSYGDVTSEFFSSIVFVYDSGGGGGEVLNFSATSYDSITSATTVVVNSIGLTIPYYILPNPNETTIYNPLNADQNIGEGSHAEGYLTQAIGPYSHVEGQSTQSIGINSHAEGSSTITTGNYSHAEGIATKAIGSGSHAEGDRTQAIGGYSHAEGLFTQAFGNYSHAEGYVTHTGQYFYTLDSVSSGVLTISSGYTDVSAQFTTTGIILEDSGTFTWYQIDQGTPPYFNSPNSIVTLVDTSVGGGTNVGIPGVFQPTAADILLGNPYSHAEGDGTIAIGVSSHSEGLLTSAIGDYSHAEGTGTQSIGDYSHAEGSSTITTGTYSHAEGGGTQAIGTYSHAEGGSTQAIGALSHAEGSSTQAIGTYSHAEGGGTVSGAYAYLVSGTSGNNIVLNPSYGNVMSEFTSSEVFVYNSFGIGGEVLNFSATSYNNITSATTVVVNSIGLTIPYYILPNPNETTIYNPLNADQILGIYSHAEGFGTQAIGGASHAEGNRTTAIGISSHAEGGNTQAIGVYSHAEGNYTQAFGQYSHSEGISTSATTTGSHAEGSGTTASGIGSHAEGFSTIASGQYSHAEGYFVTDIFGTYFNKAIGIGSHAEGGGTMATGTTSHSEGLLTSAIGIGSHAEGESTKAIGKASHAEGKGTQAIGRWSHAEGQSTQAIGDYSHAEGVESTIAIGSGSHAEGTGTQAIGNYSHSEGTDTYAGVYAYTVSGTSGDYIYLNTSYGDVSSEFTAGEIVVMAGSVLVGYVTNFISSSFDGGLNSTLIRVNPSPTPGAATVRVFQLGTGEQSGADIKLGQSSHAEGQITYSIGVHSHAEGGYTTAIGGYSHAQGWRTKSIGIRSFASGSGSTASGEDSFIHSNNSIVTGDRSVVLGGQGISGTSNDFVYVPSLNINVTPTNDNRNTQILSRNSSTGNVEYIDVSTISGGTSTTFTGNTSDSCITDLYVSNIFGCSPITIHDSIQSVGSTASGLLSTALGSGTQAIGEYSHAEGYRTIANGFQSHAEGTKSVANGENSHAGGFESNALNYAEFARSSSNGSGNYGQHGIFTMYGSSTGIGGVAMLFGDGNTDILLIDNSAYRFDVKGVAISDTGALASFDDSVTLKIESGLITFCPSGNSKTINSVCGDMTGATITLQTNLSGTTLVGRYVSTISGNTNLNATFNYTQVYKP